MFVCLTSIIQLTLEQVWPNLYRFSTFRLKSWLVGGRNVRKKVSKFRPFRFNHFSSLFTPLFQVRLSILNSNCIISHIIPTIFSNFQVASSCWQIKMPLNTWLAYIAKQVKDGKPLETFIRARRWVCFALTKILHTLNLSISVWKELWDTLTLPFYYLDQILDFHRIADRNKFGSFNFLPARPIQKKNKIKLKKRGFQVDSQ